MLMRARFFFGVLVLAMVAACSDDVTQDSHTGGAAGQSAVGSGPSTSTTSGPTGAAGDPSTSSGSGGGTGSGGTGQSGAGGQDTSGTAGTGGSNDSDGGPGGSTNGGDAGPLPPLDGGSSIAGKKGLWDFAGLLRIRGQAASGALKPAYDAVIAQGEAAMTVGPFSVMNKTTTPPSGDKHDYMGMARYFWPDPANPTGPYISKDGQSNPDVDSAKYDYRSMFTMSGAVNMLGLSYFLTRDEKYAQKAHEL